MSRQSFKQAVRSNSLGTHHSSRQPEKPRQNMEPSDMEPEDARRFIHDLMVGLHGRVKNMSDDHFTDPRNHPGTRVPNAERAKQYYGNDRYQLLSGIQAALREWDESGKDVQELKEKYGGQFVEGVEIGERLAVYSGSDFTFSTSNGGQPDSKFTFTQ